MRILVVILYISCVLGNLAVAKIPQGTCGEKQLDNVRLEIQAAENREAIEGLELTLSYARLEAKERTAIEGALGKELARKNSLEQKLNRSSVCL